MDMGLGVTKWLKKGYLGFVLRGVESNGFKANSISLNVNNPRIHGEVKL